MFYLSFSYWKIPWKVYKITFLYILNFYSLLPQHFTFNSFIHYFINISGLKPEILHQTSNCYLHKLFLSYNI